MSGNTQRGAGPGRQARASAGARSPYYLVTWKEVPRRPDGVGRYGLGRDGLGRDGLSRDGAGRDGAGRDWVGRDGIGREWARVLALLPAHEGRSAAVLAALRRAGLRVVVVRPGDRFARTGEGFRVRPGAAEDLRRVLSQRQERGGGAELVVHAWTADDPAHWDGLSLADRLAFGLHSLHAVTGQVPGSVPGVLVLTRESVDITGGEPVDPARAMLHAAVRTLALEDPRAACSLIDIGPGEGSPDGGSPDAGSPDADSPDADSPDADSTALAAEIRAAGRPVVTALRGNRRWVRVKHDFVPRPDGRPALRRDGRYLITGGLGGVGLVVAKGLARTGLRPRLVLLGRSAATAGARPDLAEIVRLGAEVRVAECDVTDAGRLRSLLAEAGPVHGVFHLAGVLGDDLDRGRARAEATLAPKVAGTVALADAFAGLPAPELFVGFGSRAGVDGLAGHGDYAAANGFLSSFAERGFHGARALAIDWPSWQVGMAVARQAAGNAAGSAEFGIPPERGIEMLLELLDGPPRYSRVAVRPFKNGHPMTVEDEAPAGG